MHTVSTLSYLLINICGNIDQFPDLTAYCTMSCCFCGDTNKFSNWIPL